LVTDIAAILNRFICGLVIVGTPRFGGCTSGVGDGPVDSDELLGRRRG
jgi:hypothetical protein